MSDRESGTGWKKGIAGDCKPQQTFELIERDCMKLGVGVGSDLWDRAGQLFEKPKKIKEKDKQKSGSSRLHTRRRCAEKVCGTRGSWGVQLIL